MAWAVFADDEEWAHLWAKPLPKAHRERLNKQDIFATVLFGVKMNFPPASGEMNFQETVRAERGARLLENCSLARCRHLSSDGNPSWKNSERRQAWKVWQELWARKFKNFQTWTQRRVFLYWTGTIPSTTNQHSCVNCISAPSISINKNLVLFSSWKGRFITNAGSVTDTGLVWWVLLTAGRPFIARSHRSEEEVSVRGGSVEKCSFVFVGSTCQQSPGRQPSLLGLLSVSNTSSLESEAWMLFFKP